MAVPPCPGSTRAGEEAGVRIEARIRRLEAGGWRTEAGGDAAPGHLPPARSLRGTCAGCGRAARKELRRFAASPGRLISQLPGKALSSTSLNKSLLLQTDSYFSPSVQRCLLK